MFGSSGLQQKTSEKGRRTMSEISTGPNPSDHSGETSPVSIQAVLPPISESKVHLVDKRVVQRELLYIIGISSKVADVSLLRQEQYFGQYGAIKKLVINSKVFKTPKGRSYSVYINFSTEVEASLCFRACHNITLEGMKLKVAFGTTKYCNYFLRDCPCELENCTFLHEVGNPLDTFTREEIKENKHIQASNSIFPLLEIQVINSDKHILPSASLTRTRYFSDQCYLEPPVLNKKENSVRSRWSFAVHEDSEETRPIPQYIKELYRKSNAAEFQSSVNPVIASQIAQESWATDVIKLEPQHGEVLIRPP